MAPHEHDHYAYSNPEGYNNVRQLVRDMVDSLEVSGFDWSEYDNDGDGYGDNSDAYANRAICHAYIGNESKCDQDIKIAVSKGAIESGIRE